MIELLDEAGNVIGYYDGQTGDTTPVDVGATADAVTIWGSRQWNSQGGQPYAFADGTQAVVGADIMAIANYQTTGTTTESSVNADAIAAAAGLTKVSPGVYQSAAGALMKYVSTGAGQGNFVPTSSFSSGSLSPILLIALAGAAILITSPKGKRT